MLFFSEIIFFANTFHVSAPESLLGVTRNEKVVQV